MLTEYETTTLRVLLARYGAKSVIDGVATIMQNSADASQGAQADKARERAL